MTYEEHKSRHRVLHSALDEIVADYLAWNRDHSLTNTNLMELMDWSRRQTQYPMQDRPDTVHTLAVCAHCGDLVDNAATHMCAAEKMEHDR